MPFNLDTWLHSRRDELTRFTDIELQAEILRQQIAELESLPLPSPLLTMLRIQLRDISDSAALTCQGRSYQKKLIAMAMEARATGRVPEGDSEMAVLREYRAWLDRMEEADRVRLRMKNRCEMMAFRKCWWMVSWKERGWLIRWQMRMRAAGAGKMAGLKLSKVAVGWLLWVGRR